MSELEQYLTHVRERMNLPYIQEPWYEVLQDGQSTTLVIQNGLYGYVAGEADGRTTYSLCPSDTARLIIILQDALTASLEAAKKKEQSHVTR